MVGTCSTEALSADLTCCFHPLRCPSRGHKVETCIRPVGIAISGGLLFVTSDSTGEVYQLYVNKMNVSGVDARRNVPSSSTTTSPHSGWRGSWLGRSWP